MTLLIKSSSIEKLPNNRPVNRQIFFISVSYNLRSYCTAYNLLCAFFTLSASSTFEELSRKLAIRDIEGALVDSYVAAYHKDKFGKFRVNNIIQAPKAFGMVLGPKLSTTYLYGRFKAYLEDKKAELLKDIEENTNTLTVSIVFSKLQTFFTHVGGGSQFH